VDEVVRALQSLMPEFAAFGNLLSQSYPGVESQVFSHRHADAVHSLGVSCFPAGSNELDERCVSLIVNIIELEGLSVRGFVQWQAPSFQIEAETAIFSEPSVDDLVRFRASVRGLLDRLQAAVECEYSTM
jgi:hypothetical protein